MDASKEARLKALTEEIAALLYEETEPSASQSCKTGMHSPLPPAIDAESVQQQWQSQFAELADPLTWTLD
jgi:hypothetical protein